MITFYAGNTLKAITERILNELPRGGTDRHIVLVPDRYTLAVERAVAAKVGASINIDVLTFARLATTVLGREAQDCLNPEGCTILLSKALYRCREKLQFYRHVCDMPGFANEMYSSLVAVRESGIQVADLRRAAEGMSGRMRDKTLDLATIFSEYLSLLADMDDPTTRLEKLVERIPDASLVAETHFYVVDFYCFNQVQYKVLRQLMQYAKSMRIGYIDDEVGRDNRRIYPADLRKQLLTMAAEIGLLCETKLVYEPLPPHKQMIQDSLFGYNELSSNLHLSGTEGKASIRLFRAQDITAEIRTVCAEICALLREGYRYRDIAIVCAGGEAYDAAFRAVFAEYGIPLFRDEKVLLSDSPVVRFILDLMEMERQNFAYDSVMKVVKNAFFDMDTADVDYFENYCLKYNIAYTRFLQPFSLADKYDDLERAERVRQALVAARLATEQCGTVADYVAAIRDFMRAYNLDERFLRFRMRQEEQQFADDAKRSEQVPTRLGSLLDLTTSLIGDESIDLAGFLVLMRSSLESVRISLPPQSVDCVYIGEAKDSHYDRVRAMFVVGAEDGVLPETPSAGTILSDGYHAALQAQNLVIFPSTKESGRYAMFYLEQLLLLPEDRLYVSLCADAKEEPTSRTTPAGQEVADASPANPSQTRKLPQYPSLLINSLSTMFHLPVEDGLGHSLSTQIAGRANAYKMLLRVHRMLSKADCARLYAALSPADRSRYDALFATNVHPLSDANHLFFYNELTSISQLETYFNCPYRHFVQYGLRAHERKEGMLDVRETGDVLHRVLELFFTRNAGRIDSITPEDVNDEIDACLNEVLSQARYRALNESERKIQLLRLRRESHIIVPNEVKLAKLSTFKPAEFEVVFGKVKAGQQVGDDDEPNKIATEDAGGNYDAIPLGNGISLSGKVDRIDRRDNEYIVIDYKSGSVSIAISDIYIGAKIQLYAYLGALCKGGNVPVGAFYKHISGAFLSEKSKDDLVPMGALRGHPINELALLQRIDPGITPTTAGTILTVRKKEKRGAAKKAKPVADASACEVEWRNYDKYGMLLTRAQLADIIAYVKRVMCGAVEEIRAGYLEAKPRNDKICTYCKAYDMCPNAAHIARKTPRVTLDSFAGGEDNE